MDTSKKAPGELQRGPVSLNDINIKLSIFICELIEELGVQDYSDNGTYIHSTAPCHNGDNPTGWTYFYDSGRWHCWTHKCHEKYGGRCTDLIKAALKVDAHEAINKAISFIEKRKIDDETIEGIRKAREEARKHITKNYWKMHNEPFQIFSELTLDNLNSATRFAEQRSLDPNIFSKYGIGYAYRGPLSKRIVVPVRNIREKIVGFTGRILTDSMSSIKWLHWPTGPKGFKTGLHFFNIEKAFRHNASNGRSDYILVEGPFDVIKMEAAGIHNSVCTFGNGVSEGQMEVLKQIGATKIIIAYDGDKPGSEGAGAAAKKLEKKLFSVGIIELGRDVFPDWDSAKLGGLDWANPNVHESLIKELMEKCYDNWNSR